MNRNLMLLMFGAAALCAAPGFAQTPATKTTEPAKTAAPAAEPAKAAAATPAPAANSQQQRMKDCNAKAGDKKGDERKNFMSSCLKG